MFSPQSIPKEGEQEEVCTVAMFLFTVPLLLRISQVGCCHCPPQCAGSTGTESRLSMSPPNSFSIWLPKEEHVLCADYWKTLYFKPSVASLQSPREGGTCGLSLHSLLPHITVLLLFHPPFSPALVSLLRLGIIKCHKFIQTETLLASSYHSLKFHT